MEVHHPHHLTHKKKWHEYFLEFIMLFVAVSLGFFAENVRERQIEKHREISYLKNVHEDLLLDLNTIDTVMIVNQRRMVMLDSLFALLDKGEPPLADLYYYFRNMALRATFETSHIGFDQIKSAGGLRMIKNRDIISGIQQYENTLGSMYKLEETREHTLEQARFRLATVLDAKTNYIMTQEQLDGPVRFQRPKTPAPFFNNDRSTINELVNLTAFSVNTSRYLNQRLSKMKRIASELDEAILKEYGKEFNH